MGEWWRTRSAKSQDVMILGIVWLALGLGVLDGANTTLHGAPHLLIPAGLRGFAWLATGAVAVAAGATQRRTDAACGLLIVMPVVRSVSYLWAWIAYLLPGGSEGVGTGWYQAAFHFLLVLLVWRTAGRPSRAGSVDAV